MSLCTYRIDACLITGQGDSFEQYNMKQRLSCVNCHCKSWTNGLEIQQMFLNRLIPSSCHLTWLKIYNALYQLDVCKDRGQMFPSIDDKNVRVYLSTCQMRYHLKTCIKIIFKTMITLLHFTSYLTTSNNNFEGAKKC